MNLAEKEKRIQLLQSKIKENRRLFKQKISKMKGGAILADWKKEWVEKYHSCLEEKQHALECMKSIKDYLEENLKTIRAKSEREYIRKQITKLEEELQEMKISK